MTLVVTDPPSVAITAICEMRSEQDIAAIIRNFPPKCLEFDSLQNNIAVRITEDLLFDLITPVETRVDEVKDGNASLELRVLKPAMPLFFGKITVTVGDD
jgi:hypothetical protein